MTAILLGGLTLSQTAFAGNGQVTICHKPGTPAEQTKEVDSPSVPAHLAHGDKLGPCDDDCPTVIDEVCGIDGITYLNACEAEKAGVPIAHPGECNDE